MPPPDPRKRQGGPKQPVAQPPKRKGWGSVARKGGQVVREDRETASEAWQKAVARAREHPPTAPGEWEKEEWVDEGPVERAKPARPARRPSSSRPAKLPPAVADELTKVTGSRRAPRLEQRLAEATRAYERDRYPDARRILRKLADEAPAAPAVRELHGLTLYRMGKWADAIRELQAFTSLTGSYDQHPTLADSYRALGRHAQVEALWEELRQASPSAELVAEGRIVAAGSLADQGDLAGAIKLLERSKLDVRRPRDHHLRMWYALADLYERAGDVPTARQWFGRVVAADRTFFDAAERAQGLA
ncbi:MAG: tetratricopeptide repeat protein [Actinobacteria bacterium]|nr:tetratricopeptide repeat protein [Actinomycetota bacterium]